MKNFRNLVLSLIAIVAFSQRAGAKLSMSPQALGFLEGTLDFCAKADPNSADKYKARGTAIIGDATKEELDKARSSSEYKDSYDSTTSNLEKTPKEKVIKGCTEFLEGK